MDLCAPIPAVDSLVASPLLAAGHLLAVDPVALDLMILGAGVGAASMIAPGPIMVSLLTLSARRGRLTALHGAAGVAGGDSVAALLALLIVAAGTTLPAALFSTTQLVAALAFGLMGAIMLARPTLAGSAVDRIEHPARTLFLLAGCTPTSVAGWVALLVAMPFASDLTKVAQFTLGAALVSYVWHPMLGVAGSALGERLTERGQRGLAQAGGMMMVVLAAALIVERSM